MSDILFTIFLIVMFVTVDILFMSIYISQKNKLIARCVTKVDATCINIETEQTTGRVSKGRGTTELESSVYYIETLNFEYMSEIYDIRRKKRRHGSLLSKGQHVELWIDPQTLGGRIDYVEYKEGFRAYSVEIISGVLILLFGIMTVTAQLCSMK